ncbi:hypothetical protein LEP1GSC047_1704 [Leptospira inadai serovar Lyme str. 10]|uniref:Uncharacterized protein n=1 Tax=Leptospira inadai serovar Lyme str. 10 TaxID=1049790 RepID=V6HRY8_9LEPT|nr:hypothetical protein LEP1GSC047_1704 [Leptospira inadai serovar Lyme str. 10]
MFQFQNGCLESSVVGASYSAFHYLKVYIVRKPGDRRWSRRMSQKPRRATLFRSEISVEIPTVF